jgi:hypothetical protein
MNFSSTEDESEFPLPPAAFQTAAGTFITALSFSIHHRETLSLACHLSGSNST